MNIKKRIGTTVFICVFAVIVILTVWRKELGAFLSSGSYHEVDRMVETMMSKSSTPGVATVISKQGELTYQCYGYADVKNHKKVKEDSLFELGSTTKAFTALAIILLEDEGYIAGSDDITDYLSWFTPTYNGKQVNITIDQLLAHTSGIPSWSIRLIPEGTSDDLLVQTIHNIANVSLDTYPGTKHNYATVNYDILALIIEEVTGQKYQDFVTDNILLPLGMTESYFSTGQETVSDNLTKGYKAFFGKSIDYNAPRYYGNIAAGYLVTNVKELGYWINSQLGIGDIPDKLRSAIKKSHEADQETAGYVGTNKYYSYGWNNSVDRKVISHSGSNPNYSSQAIVDLERQEAIFVLANLDSSVPSQIATNIYENLNGRQMNKFSYDDFYILLDLIFSILSILTLVILCFKVKLLLKKIEQSLKLDHVNTRKYITIILGIVLRIILVLLILSWPYFMNYNYYLNRVWMSNAIFVWEVLAVISLVLTIITKMKVVIIVWRKKYLLHISKV